VIGVLPKQSFAYWNLPFLKGTVKSIFNPRYLSKSLLLPSAKTLQVIFVFNIDRSYHIIGGKKHIDI
jgi:hypothetical protein